MLLKPECFYLLQMCRTIIFIQPWRLSFLIGAPMSHLHAIPRKTQKIKLFDFFFDFRRKFSIKFITKMFHNSTLFVEGVSCSNTSLLTFCMWSIHKKILLLDFFGKPLNEKCSRISRY